MAERISLSEDGLARECRTLAVHLVGAEPSDASVQAYVRAHRRIPFRDPAAPPVLLPVDDWCLRLARRGGGATRIADAYAGLFRRRGPLRQKLTLALAVVEHAPPHHRVVNTGSGVGALTALVHLTGLGARFALALATGLVLLGPAHLVSRPAAPEAGSSASGSTAPGGGGE